MNAVMDEKLIVNFLAGSMKRVSVSASPAL